MCECYFYSNAFIKIENEIIVFEKNMHFPKKKICVSESAYFEEMFSSAHDHIERISGSRAIDLTFIISMDHRIVL